MHAKFPITVHMLFIRENNILLSRRFQTGYMDGYYSVPAGHLDGGETITRAAIRESYEETGTTVSPQDISFATVIHRYEDEERVDFFVWVRHWDKEPVNTETHKCDDLSWFPLSDLPVNLIPYIDQGLKNALQGIPFSAFGWKDQV